MDFRQALKCNDFMFLDGAMGTMLQASGLPSGMSPEVYCLENPQTLESIHKRYIAAGIDIVTTCTFGGNPFKLEKSLDLFRFNSQMAKIARSAASSSGKKVYVAGNLGPSGHFQKPLGPLEPTELIEGFARQVRALVAGGVDLIFIETQFDLAEARAAVIAARQVCDLPIMVSMTFENGLSLTGSTPQIFAETMLNQGVDVIGTNCSLGPEQMLPVVQSLTATSSVPVMAEPNAGLPELVGNTTVFPLAPRDFAIKTADLAEAGAQILGGCCGTTPQHIEALRDTLQGITPPKRIFPVSSGICLTSRSSCVHIGAGHPFAVIGERINPTGKKKLSAELQNGLFDTALQFADEQIAFDANILDVNVGAPLVDETQVLPRLVELLVSRTNVPLSLDSPNPLAIANALPYCPASFLVNSISGEHGRMEKLGPLCRDYGAPFILLPLEGKQMPQTVGERIKIVEKLLCEAERLSIPRRLVMVDILALSVSSKQDGGRQCMELLRWCQANSLPTTLGLSNISFGLPARELLNATFLGMCIGAGLNACIANPSGQRLREVVDSARLLSGMDAHAERFIARYANWKPGSDAATTDKSSSRPVKTPGDAVVSGDKENIVALLESKISAGTNPFSLVEDELIPAITKVGELYEKKEYFLPQLIRSAETMQLGFAFLKPYLAQNSDANERPVVVMATVEGDIHDIGKNIVSLLLGNHGFEVIDAGKDVSAQAIVECAEKNRACIIGLSALMTTTMVHMAETIQLVRDRGLAIKVMVGGAAVTQAFADSIGADAYCPDAVCAVRKAQQLLEL